MERRTANLTRRTIPSREMSDGYRAIQIHRLFADYRKAYAAVAIFDVIGIVVTAMMGKPPA